MYESSQAMKSWEERVEFLKEGLPILPYPAIDARELAQESISRRRPFLEGDKGLRDRIPWACLMEAALEDDCVYVLVTDDHGFYEGDSHGMHNDLQEKLVSAGLAGRIEVRRSLQNVVEEFVKPVLKPEEKVEVAVNSGQIPDFTNKSDSVALALDDYLRKTEIPEDWIADGECYGADLDVVLDAVMIDLESTLVIDDQVLATSVWEADVSVDLSLPGYRSRSETVIVTFTVKSLVEVETLVVESHEVSDLSLAG